MSEPDTSAEDQTTDRAAGRFERSAADRIRDRSFPAAVRGYDRQAVDEFVDEVADLVAELEGRQSRGAVVQRALDEVGEETAGILQRAHETADEITARSRAQAEGRLQRADRETELARRQADEYAEQVVIDTRLLWDERVRLLDDIRQLADDVLATADEAAERVSLPEALVPPEGDPGPDPAEPGLAPADPPTAEVELNLLPGGPSEDEELDEPETREAPVEPEIRPLDEGERS